MPADRSEIRDARGRPIPVTRARIVRATHEDETPPNRIDPAEQLRTVASRVRRLTVSRVDPEAFHVERSDIARELDLVARSLTLPFQATGPPLSSPELPAADFTAIAGTLLDYCRRETAALGATEVLAARLARPGIDHAFLELRHAVDTAASLHRLFRDLAPFEGEVRAFLQSLTAGSAAPDCRMAA